MDDVAGWRPHRWAGGGQTMTELCACGQPLHYTDPVIQRAMEGQVRRLGETVKVRVMAAATGMDMDPGFVKVPRHYIALHGLMAADLPHLQQLYNWEKVPS